MVHHPSIVFFWVGGMKKSPPTNHSAPLPWGVHCTKKKLDLMPSFPLQHHKPVLQGGVTMPRRCKLERLKRIKNKAHAGSHGSLCCSCAGSLLGCRPIQSALETEEHTNFP